MSALGGARLTGTSILLAAVAVFSWLGVPAAQGLYALALLYVASRWLGRLVYYGSTFFLRSFVLRNPKAFDWLRGYLTFRKSS